ncbi:hypothetical protein KP509_26G028400 [Ceratopteris richardii]|uniref:glucan endo-1,3-beta-D-glucosidase n=1 Tax=Ceratopteris richardii TaxID=49495 RepID=A0A8T2RLK4_CERRI|nr:hypothetical protein KP509_26G028400 [Ceratopteris richardii]
MSHFSCSVLDFCEIYSRMRLNRINLGWLLSICVFFVVRISFTQLCNAQGVNWGTQASHLLPPNTVVEMLRTNGISKIKLFDANSRVLNALANTNIEVMVGLPNDLVLAMTDPAQAAAWVRDSVSRYMHLNGVNIKYVAVGNEPLLKNASGSNMKILYPALVNIQNALNAAKLGDQVKVTIPMSADVIQAGSRPSGSTFRMDILNLMGQIVAFLSQNGSPFTINIYPFISLYSDPHFPVEYAFFDQASVFVIDGMYTYYNAFDANYDSLVAALAAAGPYESMDIIVGEIGWPTDGDVNANLAYARRFNQGLLNHVSRRVGTPRRPNLMIQLYMFSLFDEDLKSIAPGNFERHWGIFKYDGRPKYSLSLKGANGASLVQAAGVSYMPRHWCVYNSKANDQTSLADSITYACSLSDCTSLGYGGSCNTYLDADGNASYAFNSYFQRQNQMLGSCDFNGLGQVVMVDPSVGICEFMIQIQTPNSDAESPARSRMCLTPILLCITIILMQRTH